MKKHTYEDYEACFGTVLYRCKECGAISLDEEMYPYAGEIAGEMNWNSVSDDCSLAFKQIELLTVKEEGIKVER
jgi:hypothetical protein